MASLIRDKGGTKRIQFMLAKGDRRTIRLGKINVKTAERFFARVENLIDSVQTATPIDSQTAQWLAELPQDTYDKLVQAGLTEPREATQKHTLGDLLDEYFDTMSVKESTRTRYAQSKRLLLDHFDKDHPLESITTRDADRWRSALESKGYAPAKIARDVSVARMFFKQAVRWSMIPSNPFEGVRAGAQTNRERLYYLTPEDAHKLIEAAPDADWRCIIALARFGGLRCPSEVLGEILTGVKTGCWFALQRPSGTLARANAWSPCSLNSKPSCKRPSSRHLRGQYSSSIATGAAPPISVRISTGSSIVQD